MTSQRVIRVVLCDDHHKVREALALFLSKIEDFEVIGSASKQDELLEIVQLNNPDVVLLDVRLGGESGVNVLRELRKIHPDQNVIMLTSFQSDLAFVEAYEAGAAAFMLKSADVDSLLAVIREVADGHHLIDVAEIQAAVGRLDAVGVSVLRSLDETDRAILRELVKGATDKQIADAVFLSVRAVRNKVSRLLRRFERDNRTQVAAFLARLPENSF